MRCIIEVGRVVFMGFARDGLFFPFDFLCDIFFFLLSLMSMISPGKFSFLGEGWMVKKNLWLIT